MAHEDLSVDVTLTPDEIDYILMSCRLGCRCDACSTVNERLQAKLEHVQQSIRPEIEERIRKQGEA